MACVALFPSFFKQKAGNKCTRTSGVCACAKKDWTLNTLCSFHNLRIQRISHFSKPSDYQYFLNFWFHEGNFSHIYQVDLHINIFMYVKTCIRLLLHAKWCPTFKDSVALEKIYVPHTSITWLLFITLAAAPQPTHPHSSSGLSQQCSCFHSWPSVMYFPCTPKSELVRIKLVHFHSFPQQSPRGSCTTHSKIQMLYNGYTISAQIYWIYEETKV